MSLKDDLLRNRRIFELLTGTNEDSEPFSAPRRKYPTVQTVSEEPHNGAHITPFEPEEYSAPPIKPLEYESQEIRRQSVRLQNDAPQKSETFSLGFGRRVNRETGMALSFSPPGPVEFPELRSAAAQTSPDPVEGLYHRLETEARRMSQLLDGE